MPKFRAQRGEAGYTLIELLVVLAILGFSRPSRRRWSFITSTAPRSRTAKTEVSNISAGLDLYKMDVGRYPTTQQGLEALMKAPEGADNWNGPYIKKTTKLNDPWGHPYNYRSPGQYSEFDLYSYGPKGDEGNTGAKPLIANW